MCIYVKGYLFYITVSGKKFDRKDFLTLHQDQNWCMKKATDYADKIIDKNGNFVLLGPSQMYWYVIKPKNTFGSKPVKVLLFGENHQDEQGMLPKDFPCIRMANFIKYLVDSKHLGFRVLGETPIRYSMPDISQEWNFYTRNSTLKSFYYGFPVSNVSLVTI